ncbi:hypothetical protein Tco_0593897 [Tanacetum coccineum]
MVDAQISTRLEDSIKKSFRSYTTEFEKKAKDERKRYIDLVEKSVKEIIKDEVKSQLPQILPKEISDFATPVIQSTINESLENIVLAKSSSQPQSTYEAAASLAEFELKKILLDKLEKSKLYRAAEQHRDLYDALRGREDKDKDEDPLAGSDQGLKKRKTSKDAEPPKGSKSKESRSSSSKGTKSQPKTFGKSVQAVELVFEIADTKMPQDQGDDLGNTEDQPNVEEASKHDRPPQTWISKIAKAGKPPLTFDELMSTPINFSAYVLNNLKIENLTQEYLVGPAFNLLKGTCKSRVELEYHLEECYKSVTNKLYWTNLEGYEYPFDLSKPLPLIEDQGRQVVPANYFFNNDLEYLKGGSLSSKYMTSIRKTKAAKYDTIKGIEDMVPSLWIPVKVTYDKYAMWGITHWVTYVKVVKKYDYGYLDEIIVRREDQSLHKFVEGDFPRLNLCDIEDMLLLLMFTRRVVILKRVEDLQLGVKRYQKKLNITRPETFRSDITKMTLYTAYNNPQGIIYQDKFQRNTLMRFDELYKFCDGTLLYVRRVLHDIASSLEMDYLPKRRWGKLDRKRSRIMIKAID